MNTRRDFLKKTAFASTSLLVPEFLQAYPNKGLLGSRAGKTLVVVQWSGGNDGLNTVVPYRNDIYYRNRPTLGKKPKEVLRLNDELGFNPVMGGLREIYEEGYMSIINSVGYPNPDRSHFRSMDIWQTASGSNEYLSTGWVGRYLDHACNGCAPYNALEMDDTLSLALKGEQKNGFAANNLPQLKRTAKNVFLEAAAKNHEHHNHEEDVAYLYKTLIDTQASADYLFEKAKTHRSRVQYPKTPLGKDLKQVSELITADTDTKIYYVNMSGFDTHANQKNQQERLLKQYSDAMKAFVKDLKQNKLLDDVLILTFSEFGRRVKQNGSNGTDHGTANNVFLIGGNLKRPGIYNPAPDLNNLDNGDLIYEIDFRQIYATLLEKGLNMNAEKVLGERFGGLDFI